MEDTAPINPIFVFTINGHHRKYYLTKLLPYLGERFCERLSAAWKTEFAMMKFSTSEAFFKSIRRAFTIICIRGLNDPHSPEARIFEGFRDNPTFVPNRKDFQQVMLNLSGIVLDVSNTSFVNSTNPKTRNGMIETLRIAVRYLAHQGMFPPDIEPAGRLEERLSSAPKCLATLSFEAGKFSTRGLKPDAAIGAFVQRNRDMLTEMKRLFWDDLLDNERRFDEGERVLKNPLLPTIPEIEDVLRSRTIPEIRQGMAFSAFPEELRSGIALKIEKLHLNGLRLKVGHKKRRAFVSLYFTHDQIQPYLESTSRALTAAFHILMIETGANIQPLEDLPLRVYRGAARHGKRQLALTKNRAGGKRVAATIADEDVYLPLKPLDGLPSAATAITIWKKLSAPLRSSKGPTQERFWVWRKAAGTHTICTYRPMINHDPWYNFLERVKNNSLLGGIPITRTAIRKAFANSKANTGDFDFIMQKAMLSHKNAETAFAYLSEGAVRAFLVSQIREFQDAWEAVSVIDVEAAAEKLGVDHTELIRRQRLGLENGLAFSTLDNEAETVAPASLGERLAQHAKKFVITTKSLISLELARRALWSQFEMIANSNPSRLLRTWIPWMAIVEGYCQRLESSRFRVRLKKVRDDVSARLSAGSLILPILW